MSENNAPPSIDPASLESLQGAFGAIWKKLLQSVDGMLPATVLSYDRAKGVAAVQIAIAVLTTRNTLVPRLPLAAVRVLKLGGGGFFVDCALKKGDTGWILASDRDIGLFTQSFKESAPNSERLHSFSDGLFIPDVMTGYTVDEADTGLTIQSLNGTVKIVMTDEKIKLAAPTVEIDSPESSFTGNVSISGTLETTGDATIQGKAFTPHTHGGVQPGGGETGPVS